MKKTKQNIKTLPTSPKKIKPTNNITINNLVQTLIDSYKGKLMKTSKKYFLNSQDIEDSFQETLIKVWKNAELISKVENIEAWITRIHVNNCLDKIKQRKNQMERSFHYTNLAGSNYSTINTSLELEDLEGLINKLPEGYRKVSKLNLIDGYSHKEISDMMQITESSSRSQLTKARKKLKQVITSCL